MGSNHLFSKPEGAHIVLGDGKFRNRPKFLTFKAFQDKTIIEWKSFSLGKKESANFILPSSHSMILNRVVGDLPSALSGKLFCNGRLFLINPNGILIGKDCCIQASHFVASTLDILDKDFLEKKELPFLGNSKNSVVNLGEIEATSGDVVLLGYHVENQGKIKASYGSVALAAGQSILVKPEGKEKIWIEPGKISEVTEKTGIVNHGEISALLAEIKADGNLYALAIQDSSKIDATGIKNEKGRIFLVANNGKEKISGTYVAKGGEIRCLAKEIELQKASCLTSSEKEGGEIYVGFIPENRQFQSEKVIFDSSSRLSADAQISGSGGKIVLAAQNHLSIFGAISCQGGKEGGNGGIVEVSSKNELVYLPACCNRSSLKGEMGTLIYDPVDVIIDNFSSNSSPLMQSLYPPSKDYAGAALLNVSDLVGYNGLAGGNVEINTATTTENPFEGNVYVNKPIIWKKNTTLTIKASHNICINAPIENMGNSNSSFLNLETEQNKQGSILIHAPISSNARPSLEGQCTFMAIADKDIEILAPVKLLASPVFKEDINGYFEARKGSVAIHSFLETFGKKELSNDLVINAGKNIELSGKNDAKIASQRLGKITLQAEENIFIHGGSSTKDHDSNAKIFAGGCTLEALLGDISLKGGTGEGSSVAEIESPLITLHAAQGNIQYNGGSGKNASASLKSSGSIYLSCGQNFTLKGGEGKQDESFQNAFIHAYGSKDEVIRVQAKKIQLQAGSSGQASAYIYNDHEIGRTEIIAEDGIFLMGGVSEKSGESFAKIQNSQGGELFLKTRGKIILLGGESQGKEASVEMKNFKGNLSLEAGEIILKASGAKAAILHLGKGGDLFIHSLQDGIKIFGGKNPQASAGLTHDHEGPGDLRVISDHGSIELLAGSGKECSSFIEKIHGSSQDPHHLGLVIECKEAPLKLSSAFSGGDGLGSTIIHSEAVGSTKIAAGGIEIISGNASSQICTREVTGDLFIDLKGSLVGYGDLFVKGTQNEALIEMDHCLGDMKLEHVNEISLQGGFGKKSSARLSMKDGKGGIYCTQVEGNVTLSGGSGKASQAIIENQGEGNIWFGSLENPMKGNLTLKAGNAESGDASCHIITSKGGSIFSYILGDYLLQGGFCKGKALAEITNFKGGNIVLKGKKLEAFSGNDVAEHAAKITLENGSLDVELMDSMIMQGSQKNPSMLAISGKEKNHLTCLIGKDLIMQGYSSISEESNQGKITIVADHNYPLYPHYGPGGFKVSKESKISSPTVISLFLGHPDNSSFEGELNNTTPYFPPYSFEGHFYDTYYPKELATSGSRVAFYYKIPEPGLMIEGILSYGLFLSASVSSEVFMRLNDIEKNRVFYPNFYTKLIDQYESFSIQNEIFEDIPLDPLCPMTKMWVGHFPFFLDKTHQALKRP